VIVAFGDSVTKGDSVAPDEKFTSIAGMELARLLKRPIKVINAGVNADTTTLALQRIERDVVAHKPSFVTIMFGVNDAGFFRPDGPPADSPRVEAGDYRRNLHRMVKVILEAGALPVLVSPLPMSPSYWLAYLPQYRENGLNYLVDQYAEIVREVARDHGVPLIDLHRVFSEHPAMQAFLPDGIHPDARGHASIADLYVHGIVKICDSSR